MKDIQQKLKAARGEKPAELVFRNGKILNVLSGEIHEGDLAVDGGRVVGIGSYEGERIVDCSGAYICPAFIDGHIHIESTMLSVPEFARAVIPHGTGSVVADPHEFANVVGLKGISYVCEAARSIPMNLFIMMSSCVPATPLESAGASIDRDDMFLFMHQENIAGVAEMMNFPSVYSGVQSELDKIALANGKRVDGHSPSLTGKDLNAYILAGISSDHECTSLTEAREKLQRGMHILIREGTAERNLHDILPLVTPVNAANFSFATDDKHPADLEDEGHIDHLVREAIAFGIDPLIAVQMATINTARHYRLKNLGALNPRSWANIILFDDLQNIRPSQVYFKGNLVADGGRNVWTDSGTADPSFMWDTMHVHNFFESDFSQKTSNGKAIKVINIVPKQIITTGSIEQPRVQNGMVVSDTERDILKLVVIERHNALRNMGLGFVRGFGLKRGALASTVAHDAHNIIIVGTNDRDMYFAALELVRMGGGQCLIENGTLIEELPLPIAGLVSDQPLHEVRRKVDALSAAATERGCNLPDPFMTLSFLALSPIPALKVTDQGLVDAEKFELTDLFV